MNTYGQHTESVQEVADFASSNKVLSKPISFSDDTVIIEDNFEAALHRSRTQGQDNDEDMDENWLCWLGIRSHELSQFYLTAPEASIDRELNASIGNLGEAIRKNLEVGLPEDYMLALNDIDGDLSSCAQSRAYVGEANPFFEKLFDLYKAGVWPCGWEGNYPAGKLVVFVPNN